MPPPVRPRDAAGLVLLRGSMESPDVLLGRRHPRARFMPDVFVTPGGGLDRGDGRPSGFDETLPEQPPGLDRASARRLRAFARCALRETCEETGILVGPRHRRRSSDSDGPERLAGTWRRYEEGERRPAFERMYLAARAITPAGAPIRFHSRFFLCEGDDAAAMHTGDGELTCTAWVPWQDVHGLPMAEVTPLVLRQARALRAALSEGRVLSVARLLWRGERRLRARPLA